MYSLISTEYDPYIVLVTIFGLILQVVGNLVYYRYINSAIVAPDAYDIVTVSPDEKLNNNQRRNLASIAKILQFAASKKGMHWSVSCMHVLECRPFFFYQYSC